MSLLAPFYLLGLAAVALPIAFHFLRRTPSGRIPFSSLMFLRPTPPRMTKRSRLQHLPLLLLRALVLCLLGIAFARPFLRNTVALESTASATQRVLFLLDTSASMRRDSLWQQATARLSETIDTLGPTDQCAVWVYDGKPRQLFSFSEWAANPRVTAIGLIQQRLDDLTPTWHDSRLGAALIAAADEVDNVESDSPGLVHLEKRRVVLISDLQHGSNLRDLDGYQWPEQVSLHIERLVTAKPTNAGVQLLSDVTAQSEDLEKVRVMVTNSADSSKEQFTLQWDEDKTSFLSHEPVSLYVPPGQSRTVALELPANGTGQQTITLHGDDQSFDNRLFVLRPESELKRILYLGSDDARSPTSARYFIERAFPKTSRRTVTVVSPGDADFVPEEWNEYALVIANEIAEPWQQPLLTYLQSGGHVVLVGGEKLSDRVLSKILGREVSLEPGEVTDYAMWSAIDFSHPLFSPFADPRFNDFTKIRFWKYWSLFPEPQGEDTKVVARFDSQVPAVVEWKVGRGRLLFLAAGWARSDSQWALSTKFVPLMNRLFDWAGGPAGAAQFFVGDPIRVPEAMASAPVDVLSPSGKTTSVEPGKEFTATDEVGVYVLSQEQSAFSVAVNLRPEESDTAPLSVDDLENLGVRLDSPKGVSPETSDAERRQLLAGELESRQKLWRWLVLTAMLVLAWETWLAHRWSPMANSEGKQHGPSS